MSCEEPDSADPRQDRIHTLDVVQIDAQFPLQLAALRLPGGGLHRLQRRAASVHPHHSVQDPVLLCEARVVLRELAASPIYRHRAPRYADDTENIKTFAGDAGHAGTAPYNLPQSRQAIDAQNKQIEIRLKVAAVEGDEAAFKELLVDLIDCGIGRSDERFRLQLEALEDLFLTLRSMAFTDDLTRLYNRRGFLRAGTRLLDGLCGDGPAALLLYVDVDNLKYINDSSGHAAGDCVLRRTAEVLRDVFRESDASVA